MKVAVQKLDGSLAFEDLDAILNSVRHSNEDTTRWIGKLADDIEKLGKDVESMKIGFQLLQTLQKKNEPMTLPVFSHRGTGMSNLTSFEGMEEVVQKAIENTRKEKKYRPRTKHPNQLQGRIKQVYELVADGMDTSVKIAEKIGTKTTNVSSALGDLVRYGFVERCSKKGKTFIYNKKGIAPAKRFNTSLHGVYKRSPNILTPNQMSEKRKKIYDCILRGFDTTEKIGRELGLVHLNELAVDLLDLYNYGFVNRKKVGNRYYYSKGSDIRFKREKTETVKQEPKEVKEVSWEESVRGRAKTLGLYVSENAIKQLALNPDWPTILDHAKHDKHNCFDMSSLAYYKKQLYAVPKEETKEETITEKKKYTWLPPSPVQNHFPNGGCEEIMEFIQGFEEKRVITVKDFQQFLHGMETKDILSVWYNWFAPQASHWLIREALGLPVRVVLKLNENKIEWTG
jgi:hypothetical protein